MSKKIKVLLSPIKSIDDLSDVIRQHCIVPDFKSFDLSNNTKDILDTWILNNSNKKFTLRSLKHEIRKFKIFKYPSKLCINYWMSRGYSVEEANTAI